MTPLCLKLAVQFTEELVSIYLGRDELWHVPSVGITARHPSRGDVLLIDLALKHFVINVAGRGSVWIQRAFSRVLCVRISCRSFPRSCSRNSRRWTFWATMAGCWFKSTRRKSRKNEWMEVFSCCCSLSFLLKHFESKRKHWNDTAF